MDRKVAAVPIACGPRSARSNSQPTCRRVVDLATGEISGQCGQPVLSALCPAVFNRHVLALDIAGIAQSLAERGD